VPAQAAKARQVARQAARLSALGTSEKARIKISSQTKKSVGEPGSKALCATTASGSNLYGTVHY
jgi:hypothetical protein